ncbi:MAG: rod shape-determining protein MreC [Candidatus Zixiibacteriota bacterium]|nr:MAG: rod shape-determining protein MreC [candidate division Zixibacteria bacterium]
MNRISTLYARYWRNIHLALVIGLSLLFLLNLSRVNGMVAQVADLIFYYPFDSVRHAVAQLTKVNEENEKLRLTIVEQAVRIEELKQAQRENLRLRQMLGFSPPAQFRLVPARVIAVSGVRVPLVATINRGTKDSVTINLPVVNQEGLVGKVSSVSPDFATVQLLTDRTNHIAVRLARSQDMGIVKPQQDGILLLDNVPIQADVKVGDTVITSGLGGVYPEGLVVGTVTEVTRPKEQVFCRIILKPAVNFNRLQELFVLSRREP